MDRTAILQEALAAGAITTVVDRRLDLMLSVLNQPSIRMGEVARTLGASDRQFLRWAQGLTGLTPKQLHRYLRVRRFCEADPRLSLAERSMLAGFYDQAHACNEIRSIVGVTASRLAGFKMADLSKTRRAGLGQTGR